MEYVRLRDLVSHKKGFAFKSELYSDSGTMVVRVSDFTLESISDSDAVYIEPSDKYELYRLSTGDILIQTVGSWANNPNSIVGKVVRVPQHCHNAYLNQNIVRIEPNDAVDKTYLFYSLLANHFSTYCVNRGQGAANQASITLETILKFKFQIHDKSTQTKIASILFKYDQLIENNYRRIHLLEQMAENLYKEWFVRFRFPGHEKVEMENGIPKGWKRGRLGDIVEFQNGFAFKSETFKEEGRYSIVTIKNVQDDGFDGSRTDKIDEIPSRMPAYCYLKEGDILLSLTGNVGRVCRVFGNDYLLNQRVAKIKAEYEYFIYSLMRTKEIFAALNIISYGTAQLNLSPVKATRLKIIVPPKELQKEYNQNVSALFKNIDKLKAENSNLIRQRDLLLPRLMSGKLEVNA